jgi:uncharacterized protein (TIGR00369 family)
MTVAAEVYRLINTSGDGSGPSDAGAVARCWRPRLATLSSVDGIDGMRGEMTNDDARLRTLVNQETNNFWNHLGILIEAVEVGYIRLRLPIRPEFGTYRREHVMHGGVVASLIDSGASAALSLQSPDEPPWTGTVSTDLSVSFLAAATTDLVAEARVLRAGRSLAWVQVDVRDAAGTLVAVGRVTVAIRRE